MNNIIKAGNSFQKFPPELLDKYATTRSFQKKSPQEVSRGGDDFLTDSSCSVFAFVDPLDLISIALTCKKFHTRTTRNNVLFRRLYLQLLVCAPVASSASIAHVLIPL